MNSILDVHDVQFSYQNSLVFSQVNFSMQPDDFIALIGSNGVGKSTLLRLILGELSPEKGDIHLFGENVARFSRWPRIGYLPQNGTAIAAGFPANVQEIVASNRYAHSRRFFSSKENKRKVTDALSLVGMESHSGCLMSELSGGQQQRILLARVLVGEPELILLDEPTVGVDSDTVRSLFALLRQLNRERGLGILMVTHDTGKLADIVTRILCLEDGSLLELELAAWKDEQAHRHKHPH